MDSRRWRYLDSACLPNKEEAFESLLEAYPDYLDTGLVDRIREQEYPHLGQNEQQVSLDYTGIGLFSFQQQQAIDSPSSSLKLTFVFGNLATHALYSQDSSAETILRRRVLSYMNLLPEDYCVVFTANTLSAFKLLAESYPFHLSAKLLLGYDHECENLDWIKYSANSKGATVSDAVFVWPELRFDETEMKKLLQQKTTPSRKAGGLECGLFAYPIVSKITGVRQSFEWINEARKCGWNVLVDVSGMGVKAMDSLGLSTYKPDFIIGSFYKIFGCDPTGFGCLIVKRDVLRKLGDSSRARAVGMIKLVITDPSKTSSTATSFHGNDSVLDPKSCAEHDGRSQEHGTDLEVVENFACRGLDHAEEVGLACIDARQKSLLYWLISSLRKLRHPPKGSTHLVRVYGSLSQNDRGSMIAFNLCDASRTFLDPFSVQRLAGRYDISLGIGTIRALVRREQPAQSTTMLGCRRGSILGVGSSSCVDIQTHMVVNSEIFQWKIVQVLCATLDFLSNFNDVYNLWAFLAKFLDPEFIRQEHLYYQSLNQETVHL